MSNRHRANGAAAPLVLLQLTVTGRPGQDGEVRLQSMYDRDRTLSIMRGIVDRYAAADGWQPTTTGEDTPE